MSSVQEAWRRYVSIGALDERLLRPSVYRAWERSHLGGASPRQMRAEQVGAAELELLLADEHHLIEAGRPYMRSLSRAAGTYQHAAMLGDARAIVLDVVGDEQSVNGPESVPGPGSLLDEAACGSNGIGTPLAEGGFTELEGPEHFIGGFHAFTCLGVPLHGPDGEVTGALSVSVRSPAASRRLRDVMVCAAHGIEAELMRLRLERHITELLEANPGDEGGPFERLRQDVVQLSAAARVRLQSAVSLLERRPQDALRLLSQAQTAANAFRQRARFFRELASSEFGPPQPVSLTERVHEMMTLLATEASTRRVEVLTPPQLPPCTVHADPRRLGRALLQLFLDAFDVAEGGGALDVWVEARGGLGEVRLLARPAPGAVGELQERRLAFPLARGLQ